MKVLAADTKFAHLGKPGSAFSAGFARRLRKMQEFIEFKDKLILDVGCGEGVWLPEFAKLSFPKNVYGSEFDADLIAEYLADGSELIKQTGIPAGNIKNCAAEELAFADNQFDIVFSHEVIEHVKDDRQSVKEMLRVLKPGGKLIIFCPNRGWPFEQHGMFWRGKYYWGNIPLLPWLPFTQRLLAPHVRNYSYWQVRALFKGLPAKIWLHSFVFPGFDKLIRRWGKLGVLLQKMFFGLEKTPLQFFGISHFLIVEKQA